MGTAFSLSGALHPVSNRGTPPPAFLAELVDWGKGAANEIFASTPTPVEIFTSIKRELGPWRGAPGSAEFILHRKAVMLEALRVLAGFESSWDWKEGVDSTRRGNVGDPRAEETGAWQVSYDSLPFGTDLKGLAMARVIPLTPLNFIEAMKRDHTFAIEYAARLLRHTVRHNGPVLRKEINPWLRRDAVEEFAKLLAA